jgi:pre-rRNA-processing protein TSR3
MPEAFQGFPPTVIVVHPRENRKKCSVEPLRGRAGFQFATYNAGNPVVLPEVQYVRLGIGGPHLSREDSNLGLLVLDGTWRWAEAMEVQYHDIPVRSLPAWRTAYPRVSKVFDDPDTGLATIEAIWLAYWCLGRDTTGLLDHYRWGPQFLDLNQEHILKTTSRNAT